jgi:branched-chain amino acid transport system ATP-binding protein
MAILEVEDIHTYYGDAYVLQGLSLHVEQGQILGLLGRNGVGKTTLVNSIVGFTPPRRGKIVFKGIDITSVSSFETIRSGMGLVPQGRRVFPALSVEENLVVAEHSPDRHGWNLQRVYALFPRLHERRRQRARTLSGGEQQMLAIGRALVTNPRVLIMDEPSEGLAPTIVDDLIETIKDLAAGGMGLVVVEQNLGVATSLADRQLVMVTGEIAAETTAAELSGDPAAQRRYLGVEPLSDAA